MNNQYKLKLCLQPNPNKNLKKSSSLSLYSPLSQIPISTIISKKLLPRQKTNKDKLLKGQIVKIKYNENCSHKISRAQNQKKQVKFNKIFLIDSEAPQNSKNNSKLIDFQNQIQESDQNSKFIPFVSKIFQNHHLDRELNDRYYSIKLMQSRKNNPQKQEFGLIKLIKSQSTDLNNHRYKSQQKQKIFKRSNFGQGFTSQKNILQIAEFRPDFRQFLRKNTIKVHSKSTIKDSQKICKRLLSTASSYSYKRKSFQNILKEYQSHYSHIKTSKPTISETKIKTGKLIRKSSLMRQDQVEYKQKFQNNKNLEKNISTSLVPGPWQGNLKNSVSRECKLQFQQQFLHQY